MAKKASLGTTWGWTKHVKGGVAVFAIEAHGRRYRVAPEDLRTGTGGWRADYYDLSIPCAATPEVFPTPEAAAAFLVTYHEKRAARA